MQTLAGGADLPAAPTLGASGPRLLRRLVALDADDRDAGGNSRRL
jgi:hypothetical protein